MTPVDCEELQKLHRVIELYGHLLPREAVEDLEEARMEFACYVMGLRQPQRPAPNGTVGRI